MNVYSFYFYCTIFSLIYYIIIIVIFNTFSFTFSFYVFLYDLFLLKNNL